MLTPIEAKVLAYFEYCQLARGHAPTLSEVAQAIGVRARSAAHKHVHKLIEKGYLKQEKAGWRGITLSDQASLYQLPLIGTIAAGRPIEAIPDESSINMADLFVGPERFALRVSGDSMVNVGILDGDTIIIQKQDYARSGQIVVALIDNIEATLKRLGKQSSEHIELIAENDNMAPMSYAPQRVKIQGILVGQLRRY